MEEEKLLSLQSISNGLRESRQRYEAVLESSLALCTDKPMLEFLDESEAEESKLDACIAEGLQQKVDVSTKFNVQLDLSELSTLLDQHLDAQVVLPETDSRTVFRTSIAPVSKRSKDPAQPRRHKISCAADVMSVLDDLNDQLVKLHSEKENAVAKEEWSEASSIVSEISQIETEIEKLEKDLLSAKKVEAVQTQEKELLSIQLQENLAKLQAQKERLLERAPVDYHEVAKVADEIEAVEKEISENHVEVLKPENFVAPETKHKSRELLQYEQVYLKDRSEGSRGLFSFML